LHQHFFSPDGAGDKEGVGSLKNRNDQKNLIEEKKSRKKVREK
jgi:hypothetical protein